MEIITSNTPAIAAGEYINNLIHQHQGDTFCLLSGGSAIAVVEHIPKPNKNECRTIFMMGDERGSRDPKTNNYLQLQSQQRDHWAASNCRNTVPEVSESLATFAKRISEQLETTITSLNNPQVIYLMGAGTDGHTAGIFPLAQDRFKAIYERDLSVVPVHLTGLRIDSRASVTPQWIMNHVDHIIGYAVGSDKKTILESLKNETQAVHERPVELWKLKPGSKVYTDQHIA